MPQNDKQALAYYRRHVETLRGKLPWWDSKPRRQLTAMADHLTDMIKKG